jgi:hypothetical protein
MPGVDNRSAGIGEGHFGDSDSVLKSWGRRLSKGPSIMLASSKLWILSKLLTTTKITETNGILALTSIRA